MQAASFADVELSKIKIPERSGRFQPRLWGSLPSPAAVAWCLLHHRARSPRRIRDFDTQSHKKVESNGASRGGQTAHFRATFASVTAPPRGQ